LKHIVGRISYALDAPHDAFVEEIVLDEETFPNTNKALFDGNAFAKILRDDD
jgi:hypothetical protein